MRSAAVLLVALVLTIAPAYAACKMQRYDRVVLYGTSEDPQVLVWDNRVHMREYVDGSFDVMNALLPHARVVSPGTRGIVQACVAGYVQAPDDKSPDDAVGLYFFTGPMRGHYGWVLGSDIQAVIHLLPRRSRVHRISPRLR